MKFIETSAKTSKNVEESFITMTKEIIALTLEKEKSMTKSGDSRAKSKIDLSKSSQQIESPQKYNNNNIK